MTYPELTTATVHGPEWEEGQGGLPLQDNHRSERISVWSKRKKKEDKPCRQLSESTKENLAGLIIRSADPSDIRRGTSGQKKEDTAATGKRHDFLTDKIPPLAPDFWHKDGYDGSPVNLTTPENFDYLYQSASNYAGLMGIKLPFRYRKGGSPPSENHRTVQGDGGERTGMCQSGRERRKAPFLSVPPSRLAGTRHCSGFPSTLRNGFPYH